MTLSTKYLVEAGSTRPETRLTAIKRKPRMSRPRRGFISAQTSGRFFQAFLRFFSLDAGLVLASVVMIRGRHPSLLDAGDADATTQRHHIGDGGSERMKKRKTQQRRKAGASSRTPN